MITTAREELLLALPTYLIPIWFPPLGRLVLTLWGTRALWLSALLSVAALMGLSALTWGWNPHYALTSEPAVATELVWGGSALLATAAALYYTDSNDWPLWQKLSLAALAGGVALVTFMLPALFVFVAMGGDTL